MDEQQVRALEIEAAKRMGAVVYFWCGWVYSLGEQQIKCDSESLPNCWSNLSETEQAEWTERVFNDFTPRFARDAEAILSALEWLIATASDPELTRTDGVYGVYWGGVTTWRGETLGIAICQAIIGTPPEWREQYVKRLEEN